MAVALVQTKLLEVTNDLDGIASLTLDSVPTEGNLLIASVVSRRNDMALVLPVYNGETLKTGANSWNLAKQLYTAVDDISAGHRGGLFWRVAGASEGSTLTLDLGATSTDLSLEVFEFSHDFTNPVLSSAEAGFMVTSSTANPSVSTGSTGISESAPVLWVGLASIRNGTPTVNADFSPTVNEAGHGSVNGRWVSEFGWLESATTDAQDWTWTIDNWLTSSRWAMLVGFVEGGSPPPPSSFDGSVVGLANQSNVRVRLSDETASSIRLSNESRLE